MTIYHENCKCKALKSTYQGKVVLMLIIQDVPRLRSKVWIKGLHDLCQTLVDKDSIVLEIGCFSGESTCVFAEYSKKVYAVDPWDDGFLHRGERNVRRSFGTKQNPFPMKLAEFVFDRRIRNFNNIIKLKGRSEDWYSFFPNKSLDLVYIDSVHTYRSTFKAICQYESKVKSGKWIAGHDFAFNWPGVVRAVKVSYRKPDLKFRDTSWAVQLSDDKKWIMQARYKKSLKFI